MQHRLMNIIRDLVRSEDYVVQKYSKVHPFKAMGRVKVGRTIPVDGDLCCPCRKVTLPWESEQTLNMWSLS